MESNDRVIVEYVSTSCNRRPGRSWCGTRTQHTSSALPISSAATRATISSLSCVFVSIVTRLPPPEPKAAAARGSHRDNWRNLILVLKATLKGPRLAPGTRLKIDLEDHGVNGLSGQQPHPIFRPERASPQGTPEAEKRKVAAGTEYQRNLA